MINKFSIFNGAKYFSSGMFQSYLVFTPSKKFIKYFSGTTWIDSWKSNGTLEKNIEDRTKSVRNFAPIFIDHHLLQDINFNGHCLIKNISIPKKVINLYISYILNPHLRNVSTDFTLGKCLFGSVKLTKHANLTKYECSGYGKGFDSRSEFSLPDGSMGKNIIIFGAGLSSSVHIDNKGKDILAVGEALTQGLHDTTLTGETIYPINFT